MLKNSKLTPKIKAKGLSLKDPRIVMRALVGVLLAANLALAVVAFKPFGGSADDLRQERARLSTQLQSLHSSIEKAKQHVDHIEIAHTEGDAFLGKYIMDKRAASAIMVEEMDKAATEAGIKALPENASFEDIEGSDTLQMMAVTASFEGSYAGLAKLVNLLEKSDKFLIIDEMNLIAPQQQQNAHAHAPSQPSQRR